MTERYSPSQLNDDDEDSDEIEMNRQPSLNSKMAAQTAAVDTEDEKLDQVLDEEQPGEEEEGDEEEEEEQEEQEPMEGPLPNPQEYDEQAATFSDDHNPALEMSVPPHMITAEKCELCDAEHSSEESAKEHYESSEHAEKVNDYLKSIYSETSAEGKQKNGNADADDDDNTEIPSVAVEITDEFIQKYKYSCTYCGLCFQEFEHMFRHEKGPMHAIRVWEHQQNLGGYSAGSPKRSRNPRWPDGFYCSICNTDLTNAEKYQEHLKTEQHETRAQRLMDTGTPAANGEAEGGPGEGGQRGGHRGGWRGGPMRGGGGGPWRGPGGPGGPVPLNMMSMGPGYGPGPGPGGPWMRGRGGPRFRPYDFGPRGGGFRGGPRGFGGGGPRGPFRGGMGGPMRGGRGGGPRGGPVNFFNSGGGPQPGGGGGYFRGGGGGGDQSQQQPPKHGYTMGTGGYMTPQSGAPTAAVGTPSVTAQTTDDQ
uniref:C2H2-type domain-containing protein n=1 Tax=Plectus sambesii TaxID=2011161 RepID=A0A914VZB9_9BILA